MYLCRMAALETDRKLRRYVADTSIRLHAYTILRGTRGGTLALLCTCPRRPICRVAPGTWRPAPGNMHHITTVHHVTQHTTTSHDARHVCHGFHMHLTHAYITCVRVRSNVCPCYWEHGLRIRRRRLCRQAEVPDRHALRMLEVSCGCSTYPARHILLLSAARSILLLSPGRSNGPSMATLSDLQYA